MPQYFKDLNQVTRMPSTLLSLHYYVINLNFHHFPDLILEHAGNHPLIRSPRILHTKRHHYIVVISLRRNKRSFLLILGCQNDLMVTLKGVQKAHPLVSDYGIHQLIYLWYQEWSFGHARFKSVKSMQTLYFPFFFFNTIELANH